MHEGWMKRPAGFLALLAVPFWVGCAAAADGSVGSRQANLEGSPGEAAADALPMAGNGETYLDAVSTDDDPESLESDGESLSDSDSDDEGCGDVDSDSMSDDDGDDDDADGIIDEADEDSVSDEFDDSSSSDGDACGDGTTTVDVPSTDSAEQPF